MPLQSVNIQNFRNISQQEWVLDPGLNVLEGENAQGKTNFLESLYFLANGRSFRTQTPESLVQFGQARAELHGEILHGELRSRLQMLLESEGKKISFQGKSLQGMAKIQQVFRVLIFTPESTALFRSSPEGRRRYFNLAMGVQDSLFGKALARYHRVLRQRNQLIEQGSSLEHLEPFNRQWAELALEIMERRQRYLDELNPLWVKRLESLTDTHAALGARWEGRLRLEAQGDVESLLNALRESAGEEARYRRTVLGPNRDDLRVSFGDYSVREVASQGQQRMLTIALKLAEADLFRERTGLSPVFLLDDIGSELDAHHLARLLEILADIHAQTVLTSAQAGSLASLPAQSFRVKKGVLSRVSEG